MERFGLSPAKDYNYPTPNVQGNTPLPAENFSPRTLETTNNLGIFKPPPDPDKLNKRRKTKVLSEDEYVERVGEIIERDFFPELEKLKAQSEYIDASDRHDSVTMRRLEERYSSRRPTPSSDQLNRLQSPATFETPLNEHRSSDEVDNPNETNHKGHISPASSWKSMPGSSRTENAEGVSNNENLLKANNKQGLDKFLSLHTSEDNESFSELMEESREEFKRTNAWMFKNDEQLSIESKKAQLALPSPESQMDQNLYVTGII